MIMSLQMLSLKYYGIVHKADMKDYMQSLQVNNEHDINDFRQHMYVVRVKPTVKPSDLNEFHPTSVAISKFNDDEEIISEKKCKQQRGRDEDNKINKVDSTAFFKELKIIDINSQLFLSSKRT